MKDQNDERAAMKWSMLLNLHSFIYNNRVHEYSNLCRSRFFLSSSNVMRSVILGEMNALILLLFYNTFMYWKRSLLGDTVSPERIISY